MFSDFSVINLVVLIVCLLVAMTVHEFMHAYVGYKLGDDTALENGRVSFNPLRHIDPVMTVLLPVVTLLLFHAPILAAKPVPFNPARLKYDDYGAAMLAAAGPFSNLGLAVLGALVLKIAALNMFMVDVLQVFVQLNVALFVFNLIPIPPLDGSRVLYAFSPEPLRRVLDQIEPYGFFIIIALVLWGGAGGYISNLITFVLNMLP